MTAKELCEAGAITIDQACAFLSVSRSTIYEMTKDGRLTMSIVGGRRTILRQSAVDLLAAGILRKQPNGRVDLKEIVPAR